MNIRLALALAAVFISFNIFSAPISHLFIKVHDENGKPVEGANVQGGFSTLMRSYVPGPDVKAITDKEGEAEIYGPAYFSVYFDVIKNGYYKSGKKVIVKQDKDQNVAIVLRQIINPIPMYAKHYTGYIPKSKVKIAFDFLKGDFVKPFGRGTNKDCYFYYDGFTKNFRSFEGELTISFPHKSDGIIGLVNDNGLFSAFKLPHTAPINGYIKAKQLNYKRIEKGKDSYYDININESENFGYFLRIRSEVDSNGEVIKANYVKIAGDFKFDPRSEGKGAAYIEMTYYLNPNINDRNMEFDTSKNLMKGLKNLEKINAP